MKFSRLSTDKTIKVWILVDEERPDYETQAIALAEGLDLPARLYHVSERRFWKYVPTWVYPNILKRLNAKQGTLSAPWPSVAICCGQTSKKVGIYLRKKYNTFIIALGAASKDFNKIIIEYITQTEDEQKILTFGPLHRIQREQLDEARSSFYRTIDNLPKPRIGLFLEGLDSVHRLTELLSYHFKISPFSLMIYAPDLSKENQLLLESTGIPQIMWNENKEDPFLGFLTHSDGIIVNNTTHMMMTEVSSLGKSILIYDSKKGDSLTLALISRGWANYFDENSHLLSRQTEPILHETKRVASLVKKALENSSIS